MLKRAAKKRLWLHRGRKTLSFDGCEATFNVESDSDAHSILHFAREESEIVTDLLSNLSPDDVFWDVGANMGIYSCLAAERGAEVHAFEPFPPNIGRLEANIRLNNGGVNTHQTVLSDGDGTVEFAASEVDPTGSGSVTIGVGSDTPTTEVESVRADTLVQSGDVPAPTIMKIDVEGSEQLVLEGAQDMLQSVRLLYCEVHHGTADHRESLESFGGSEDALRSILTDVGFSIEEMATSPNETFLKCQK
ncbi:FkbM family methyltransferase [Halococcus sp. AFM35]|uniref:FkbM family methyltransferase n=1 Tax=Halococcus sp. AFM35 TaxID=3421653 RepID=UPI003EBC1B64